jgi:hypothetical protein
LYDKRKAVIEQEAAITSMTQSMTSTEHEDKSATAEHYTSSSGAGGAQQPTRFIDELTAKLKHRACKHVFNACSQFDYLFLVNDAVLQVRESIADILQEKRPKTQVGEMWIICTLIHFS